MRYLYLSLLAATLAASGCAKKASESKPTEIIVNGHLRYSCSCLDGAGLYYVADSTNGPRGATGSLPADSILLIGDGNGKWLINLTPGLEQYVDRRTAFRALLTAKKGCLQGGVATVKCTGYRIADTVSFTLLP